MPIGQRGAVVRVGVDDAPQQRLVLGRARAAAREQQTSDGRNYEIAWAP